MIDIDLEPPAKLVEIVGFKIGGTADTSWIEERGDIIIRIPCSDGMFLLVKMRSYENHQDRPLEWGEASDVLD